MNVHAAENTGLIICASGDGPAHDLHYFYDKRLLTATAAQEISRAVIAEAHRLTELADQEHIPDAPSTQELIEARMVQLGFEVAKPHMACVWDDLTVGNANAHKSVNVVLAEHGRTAPEGAHPLLKSFEHVNAPARGDVPG